MLIGLVVGAVLGVLAHLVRRQRRLEAIVAYVTEPIGRIFLRLLFMMVLPLIVSALALGVAELRDLASSDASASRPSPTRSSSPAWRC
jgi:DAACS family dicarboxylate/amino acid:cation (Na+ or H+) symporter